MTAQVTELLESWLADDRLSSRFQAVVDAANRRRDTSFPGTPDYEGVERQSDFAAAPEQIAHGLLALAKTDKWGAFVSVVAKSALLLQPRFSSGFSDQVIVAFDRGYQFGEHTSPIEPGGVEFERLFRPFRHLGLRIITLAAGTSSFEQPGAQLGLVVLNRSTDPNIASAEGFVLVGIELDGHITCERVRPSLTPGVFRANAFGLSDADRLIHPNPESGVDLDEALFPDARRYLADTLPKIADHLTHVAQPK